MPPGMQLDGSTLDAEAFGLDFGVSAGIVRRGSASFASTSGTPEIPAQPSARKQSVWRFAGRHRAQGLAATLALRRRSVRCGLRMPRLRPLAGYPPPSSAARPNAAASPVPALGRAEPVLRRPPSTSVCFDQRRPESPIIRLDNRHHLNAGHAPQSPRNCVLNGEWHTCLGLPPANDNERLYRYATAGGGGAAAAC